MAKMLWAARAALAAAALLVSAQIAHADGPAAQTPDVAAPPVRAAPVPATAPLAQPAVTSQGAPQGQTGQITLDNGVTLNVPASYRFYPAPVAQDFLTRNNAATPSGTVLGLLAPVDTRIDQPDSWATVLSYDGIGHVASDGAGRIADPGFEAEVRGAREAQGRTFEGFAVQPTFSAEGGYLSWAERAAAPGSGGRDLRHEQRILGRRGVVGLTSIGSADQMGAVIASAPDMQGAVSFAPTDAYAAFDPASDQAARYTVPALVTGVADSESRLIADAASADGAPTAGGGLQGMFIWIAAGVAALGGVGYLLTRGRRDPNMDPHDDA